MREILFRGKKANDDKWIYGGFYDIGGKYAIFAENTYPGSLYEPPSSEVEDYDVKRETVGQYSGVNDKNGVKIFEGDIVKGMFVWGFEVESECVFKDGAFGLKWYRGDVEEFAAFTSICNVKYEVVGNVYDGHDSE